jgi:hypothetical protein
MKTYKITALKDVTVSAFIYVVGRRKLPNAATGVSQGTEQFIDSKEDTFKLRKGQSRADINFVTSASDSGPLGMLVPWTTPLPEAAVGDRIEGGGLLLIERVE